MLTISEVTWVVAIDNLNNKRAFKERVVRPVRFVTEKVTAIIFVDMPTRLSSKKKESAVKSSSDKPDMGVSDEAVSMHARPSSKERTPAKVSPIKPKVLHDEVEEVASDAAVSMRTRSCTKKKESAVKFSPAKPRVLHEVTPIKVTVERYKDDPLKIYWVSTEAKNLFLPKGNETVLEALDAQIGLLRGAASGDNWKRVVDPEADFHQEFNDPGSISRLKDKVMVLSVALDLAKSNKPISTWLQCCDDAVKLIYADAPSDVKLPKAKTVCAWYREFRENRFFPSKERLKREQTDYVDALLAEIKNRMSKVKIEDI